MKPSRSSLDRVLHLARGAAPRDAGEQSQEPLPPGLATGIAARWAASRVVKPALIWERLSYAGLAVAIAVCVTAGVIHRQPEAAELTTDEISFPDLLNADITGDPSA